VKTVWITRTAAHKPGDVPAGWHVLNIPLLHVTPAPKAPNPPQHDDVLLFTSSNAVKIFGSFTAQRHWPVYTVGDATAEYAREIGFRNVISAGKDVSALCELIVQNKSLKSERLYYASGKDIRGDLETDLRAEGFRIERSVVYATSANPQASVTLQSEIDKRASMSVLLYSPKGAQVFRSMKLDFTKLETVSISATIDRNLEGLGIKRRKVAEHPTHTALIKQLD